MNFIVVGITYYMDSSEDCNAVMSGIYGQKVTVKGQRSSFISTPGPLTCTMTFSSSGGFEVDFDEGWIQTSGVTLTLYSGKDINSPVLVRFRSFFSLWRQSV